MGPPWANLGRPWTNLGPSWANRAPTWSQFDPTWPNLAPTWGQFGAKLAAFGLTLTHFALNLERPIHPYVRSLHSMLYSTCVPRSILQSPYLHITSNSLAQANTATAIPAAIVARCPLRIDHCILPIAHCLLHQPAAHNLLPIALFRRLGPAECAERLNKQGVDTGRGP